MKGGYHLREIPKGVLGEVSKVEEELAEFYDAKEQGSKIMMVVELADLYGAIKAYTDNHDAVDERVMKAIDVLDYETKHFNMTLTMSDIKEFADITARAFRNGDR